MQVGKVAASPARNENLLAATVSMLEDGHPAPALASFDGAHQASSAASEDHDVEAIFR
jgi:hypothetical protein